MTGLTIEYSVEKESEQVPDDAIIEAVVNTPIVLTLKNNQGKAYAVTLTPVVAYPNALAT